MRVDLERPPAGPCAGIRVVDFSTMVSGPFCTMILGDLGADVVKVEPPRGDSMRMLGPPFQAGLSAIFVQFNRNKRSVVVDLKHREAANVVERLTASADVVVHNFRPGVAERIGIDYETLAARNSRLVYLAISGFGPDGPDATLPAYDSVVQGVTGQMAAQGAGGPPALIRSLVADKTTALTGVYAILGALLARERSGGRGQKIDVAMLDAYAAFILPDLLMRETFLPDEPWKTMPDFATRVHRTWATADGWVVIMLVEDSQWAGVCRALEREDLAGDDRFRTLPARIANWGEMMEVLEGELKRWPTDTLVDRARRFGVPLTRANGIDDFLADPQVAHNRTVFELADEERGSMRVLRNPVRLAATPAAYWRRPPELGEHTDAILSEVGFGADEIGALRAAGAIG